MGLINLQTVPDLQSGEKKSENRLLEIAVYLLNEAASFLSILSGGSGGACTPSAPSIVVANGTLIVANTNRKSVTIQNLGIIPIKVKFGTGAAADSFHYAMPGCMVADDGTSNPVTINTYDGEITFYSTGGTPRVSVFEEV